MNDSFVPCPHCGAEIKADAKFCRFCGSSEADGWAEEGDWSDDSEDFDYEEFVADNFGDSSATTQVSPGWRAVAVILLILFGLGFLLLW
ncbi:MAG: zinc ribbon domain-containing protein [Planctomycetaceae bacterium]|jgi:uncharacterized membrane protein YvbJ|nr:zinc ribbon domain-containing protein [Planctomycetaceae bacterium]